MLSLSGVAENAVGVDVDVDDVDVVDVVVGTY